MDNMTQLGGDWTNVGFGYFNADLGKYIDYEGNIMTPAQVLETRSFIDGGGGAGSGSFINNYFENGGWVCCWFIKYCTAT